MNQSAIPLPLLKPKLFSVVVVVMQTVSFLGDACKYELYQPTISLINGTASRALKQCHGEMILSPQRYENGVAVWCQTGTNHCAVTFKETFIGTNCKSANLLQQCSGMTFFAMIRGNLHQKMKGRCKLKYPILTINHQTASGSLKIHFSFSLFKPVVLKWGSASRCLGVRKKNKKINKNSFFTSTYRCLTTHENTLK